jgi:glucokinase
MPKRKVKEDGVIIAVDIGGTNLRVALVNSDLKIVHRHSEPSGSEMSPDEALRRLKAAQSAMLRDVSTHPVAVGFALAGILDETEDIVHQTPNLSCLWQGFTPRQSVEKLLDLPVIVGNDANLAAVSEARANGPNAQCVVYLTWSTGIGGGVVYQGKPFIGRGLGVEAGHITVMDGGPECSCGGSGHLESVASGTAIAREAQKIAQRDPNGLLSSFANQENNLDARLVVNAAERGDAAASEILRNAGHYMGLGLASLAHLFCPEIIVIGGGVSKAGRAVLDPAQEAFASQTMQAYQDSVRILPATMGDDSALIGAALVGWEMVNQRLQ